MNSSPAGRHLPTRKITGVSHENSEGCISIRARVGREFLREVAKGLRAAEAQVHEWTGKGELPFPDMSEEQREALKGTPDFPPTGSIEHKAIEQSETGKD